MSVLSTTETPITLEYLLLLNLLREVVRLVFEEGMDLNDATHHLGLSANEKVGSRRRVNWDTNKEQDYQKRLYSTSN